MLIIKKLTLKNFLSIGAVTQEIDFNRKDLTLVLGENLDLGGDGARNGTGKTTAIQGLSYALFGSPINKIKQDNLINRTNGKNMLVTIEFSMRGVDYKIVRGRKPNVLKFYVNNQEQEVSSNDSQGDSRETQDVIEGVLCMTPDMFRQVVALNTYNEPFLAMKVSDQRTIIEELLGITLLSEKADAIKDLNKTTKEQIQREEFRIHGIEEANSKIQEQIDSLKKRQRLWLAKKDEDLNKLANSYAELSKIDIEQELEAHRQLALYNINREKLDKYNALLARQTSWLDRKNGDISTLEQKISKLQQIDIASELAAHKQLAVYSQRVKDSEEHAAKLSRLQRDLDKETKLVSKLEVEIAKLREHKCYACGQDFHDDSQATVLAKKIADHDEAIAHVNTIAAELKEHAANTVLVPPRPTTVYSTEEQAFKHSSDLANLLQQLETKRAECDPYSEQLLENAVTVMSSPPATHYDTEAEAHKHSAKLTALIEQIESKHSESDPYAEQIEEMGRTGLQTINFDELNKLTKILQHQEYLLDLLTNKKSFVRKRIIEQNLSYLNGRLTYYLEKIGLPHQVVFQNDLSVEITELGRDLDFHNLSRGEMNRLIIALSFAFRDVWESLYSSCNMLFIDELIDSGMDTIGTENSLALLKDMVRRRSKSIWLVSHKDELVGRVNSVLRVIKESGFTSYESAE